MEVLQRVAGVSFAPLARERVEGIWDMSEVKGIFSVICEFILWCPWLLCLLRLRQSLLEQVLRCFSHPGTMWAENEQVSHVAIPSHQHGPP